MLGTRQWLFSPNHKDQGEANKQGLSGSMIDLRHCKKSVGSMCIRHAMPSHSLSVDAHFRAWPPEALQKDIFFWFQLQLWTDQRRSQWKSGAFSSGEHAIDLIHYQPTNPTLPGPHAICTHTTSALKRYSYWTGFLPFLVYFSQATAYFSLTKKRRSQLLALCNARVSSMLFYKTNQNAWPFFM